MTTAEYQAKREKLLAFIKKCCRTSKPDLHSFKIGINGGFAFVECDAFNEVSVEQYGGEDGGYIMRMSGQPASASEFLLLLGADLKTIEQ